MWSRPVPSWSGRRWWRCWASVDALSVLVVAVAIAPLKNGLAGH
jgi:hypothetical protein